jgi:hypothetical protein
MNTVRVLILFAILTSIACKKSKDDLASERSSLLVDKKWQLTDYDQDWIGDNGTPVHFEQLDALPPYLLDDYVIFKSDNTFETNDNQLTDPDDPIATYSGTWHFKENGAILVMQLDIGNPVEHKITSLTATEWKDTLMTATITNTYTYSVIP